MDNLSEKIARFTNLVVSDAGKKRDELIAKMDKAKEDRMQQMADEIRADADAEMERKIQKVKKENNERLIRTETDLKKKLLIKREEIVSQITEAVYKKLVDFTESADYEKWLFEKVQKAVEETGEGNKAIQLDSKDFKKFADDFKKQFAGITVEENSSAELIGGVVVLNTDKNICVDYSMKTLLEDAQDGFLQKSGLNIG